MDISFERSSIKKEREILYYVNSNITKCKFYKLLFCNKEKDNNGKSYIEIIRRSYSFRIAPSYS